MKDLLLENYIKEVMYDLHQKDLHEMSLKDFAPKTALETGLQIGTLSLLAFLGVEMNKSSELPTEPEAQAELVVDAAEDLGILKSSDLEKTEEALEDAFEEQSMKAVYDRIPANDKSILRNWLSDKKQGHEVSIDGHILSREDFKVFQSLNDENEMKGLEPISIEKFMEMLENEKKWEKYRLEKLAEREKEKKDLEKFESFFDTAPTPDRTVSFNFEKIGLDSGGNRSPMQFVKDAEFVSKNIQAKKQTEEFKVKPQNRSSVLMLDHTLTSSVSFLMHIDEDGYWKDGKVATAEDMARYYEKAWPQVKEVVDAYLSDDQ